MPRLKVIIQSEQKARTCSRHPQTRATSIRITTTTRKLNGVPAQTIRRPECAVCASKPAASKQGVVEQVRPL